MNIMREKNIRGETTTKAGKKKKRLTQVSIHKNENRRKRQMTRSNNKKKLKKGDNYEGKITTQQFSSNHSPAFYTMIFSP